MLVGNVPDILKELTVVEEAMIAQRRVKSCIIHLKELDDGMNSFTGSRANIQRGVRGHYIMFPLYPKHISKILPITTEDLTRYMCILFVGSTKPSKE